LAPRAALVVRQLIHAALRHSLSAAQHEDDVLLGIHDGSHSVNVAVMVGAVFVFVFAFGEGRGAKQRGADICGRSGSPRRQGRARGAVAGGDGAPLLRHHRPRGVVNGGSLLFGERVFCQKSSNIQSPKLTTYVRHTKRVYASANPKKTRARVRRQYRGRARRLCGSSLLLVSLTRD